MCTDELARRHQCYGGFARMKKVVDDFREDARKQSMASLFLNAGDTFQKTAYYTIFKWKIVADLVPLLGFDVMSLGNHEFDDGVKDLSAYLQNITIPVLASNLNLTLEPSLQLPILKRSIVLEVNGHKVGIIGYLTPDTKEISNAGNVIFLDEIESIRAEAKTMKSNGINIIIALGHSGFYRDVEIARNVPEVSLIVGGHTHSLLYTPNENPPSIDRPIADYPFIVQQPSGRKVPIVQAYCNTKYLGKLRVTFNDNGDAVEATGNTILLDASYAEGLRIVYDLSRPAGSRIKSILIKCANCTIPKYQFFNPHYNHTVVTTTYLLQGGNGFTMIKNEHLQYEPIAITAANAISNYISVQRVVYPGLDGRVTVENIESVSQGVRRSGFSVTLIVCILVYLLSPTFL